MKIGHVIQFYKQISS